MEKFYIMVNNHQEGPFTKEEIISKGFSNTSYIYNKSLGGGKRYLKYPTLLHLILMKIQKSQRYLQECIQSKTKINLVSLI
jgi:hypothetical protein